MTALELQIEWEYRFNERLGILCQGGKPDDQQIEIARREADEAIEKLKVMKDPMP